VGSLTFHSNLVASFCCPLYALRPFALSEAARQLCVTNIGRVHRDQDCGCNHCPATQSDAGRPTCGHAILVQQSTGSVLELKEEVSVADVSTQSLTELDACTPAEMSARDPGRKLVAHKMAGGLACTAPVVHGKREMYEVAFAQDREALLSPVLRSSLNL
jgi:hypothetical protein